MQDRIVGLMVVRGSMVLGCGGSGGRGWLEELWVFLLAWFEEFVVIVVSFAQEEEK